MENSPKTPKSPKYSKSPKSPKSPKFQTSTATYIISAHGTMLTSMLGTPQTKKYHAINIPENVELYTFVDLGKCMVDYKTDAYFICNLEKETQKEELQSSLSPAFKFIHERGKTNKFPELFLTPDVTTPVQSYKGIIHCIPEHYRTSTSRGDEIIYNIDAKNTKDCVCSSIVSKSTAKPYNYEKNYSAYYKTQLEGYKYDPTSTSINKCGPILMSEAVQIIQAHSNNYYEPTCVIQIYVSACLAEIDLKTSVHYARLNYELTRKIDIPPPLSTRYADEACIRVYQDPHTGANPESKVCYAELVPEPTRTNNRTIEESSAILRQLARRDEDSKPIERREVSKVMLKPIETRGVSKAMVKPIERREVSESDLMNVNYEIFKFKHNSLTKVSVTNVVESLRDFKAIPLISPLISKYRLMYQHKIFDFITYKDAYMDVMKNLYDMFSGTHEEIIDQIERKYRSRDRDKLDFYFLEALDLLKLDGSHDSLSILPKINEINLVNPFIREESKYFLISTIYLQLKELIEKQKQKLKMGQGRRKKTLRRKYKKRNSRRLKHAKQTYKTTRPYLH